MNPIGVDPAMSRRSFLAAAGAAALSAACSHTPTRPAAAPTADAIVGVEAARPHTGRTVTATLTPQPVTVDLGGPRAATLAYGSAIPAPTIRAQVGDELAVTVANGLDHPTSVHWHGIALRNDMDGAAPATANIAPGATFTYQFSVSAPGTYWAHPHTGLDADYGLYLPVIVDDPHEPGRYDAEWIVVLDDWTAGVGSSPAQIFDGLRGGAHAMPGMDDMAPSGPMPGVGGVGTSDLLGGDAGDVAYPYYLVNGRIPVRRRRSPPHLVSGYGSV